MATMLSGISKQLRTIRHNALVWCMLFFVALFILLARFFQLQVLQHHTLLAKARDYHERTVPLPATRGRLLDRKYEVLALDDRRLSLYADPTLVQNPAFMARQLAPVIGMPEAEIYACFTRQLPFVWVKRDLSREAARQTKALAAPGVVVKQDGWRYTVTIATEKLPASAGVTTQLAEALGITTEALIAQIGDPEAEPPAPKPATPPVTEPHAAGSATVTTTIPLATPPPPRRLQGLFPEGRRRAVDELRFPGISFTKQAPNYSVGVDPRIYLAKKPVASPNAVANQLAPVLRMTPEAVLARLRFRPRFVWLKRGMPEETLQAVQRLQGTMWVVEPGRVLSDYPEHTTPEKAMANAVAQIDYVLNKVLNGKQAAAVIARDAIHAALQPGAQVGAMYQGKPSLKVTRFMYYKPIAGVMYGLPGISVQQERRRYYPYNTLASASLGLVKYGPEGAYGVFGLEATQDDPLHGDDGSEAKEIDGRQMTIPERRHRTEPTNGHDVVLTLDLYIQQVAERELAKAVQTYGAKGGTCIVTDPNTGEILALAVYPAWDANAPSKSKLGLINNAISNVYEPGSTFKLVATLGALEEGKAQDGRIITNCTGTKFVGPGRPIGEAHNSHGPTDPGKLLEVSCNIAAATLALQLGPDDFLKWCKALGFSTRSGIELAGEARGRLNAEEITKTPTLARMGFGQSVNVTPLQMVTAYAVVANGGTWHQPHLVKGHVKGFDQSGQIILSEKPVPRRTVCSEKTATLLRSYLERVVVGEHGTGGSAEIPGYRVAGKTGTAQKALGGGRRGYSGYVGSFVGFVPAEKPRLAIVAVIDEPTKAHYGGVVAGPVFREVGRCALEYLNISPSLPVHTPASP
jgi:cell division protein FtsI/penicillin-binding protein 2